MLRTPSVAFRRANGPSLFVLLLALSLGSACAGGRPSASIPPRAPDQHRAPAPPPEYRRADFSEEQLARIVPVQPLVQRNAAKHGLDPSLVNGVIWVESRFQPRAKSPAGARGLMQLMPATAAHLAKQMGTRGRSYDPKFNVAAGSLYLAKLLDRFDGDVTLALASYNAGAGNVQKWMKGSGLPEHSIGYVEAVMDARARFEALRRGPEPAPTDTMLAKVSTSSPAREPQPVIAKPPAPSSDDVPVADTTPRPFSPPDPTVDPPLADTPWPPQDAAPTPRATDTAETPTDETVAPGLLPSVFDD